MSPRGRRRRAYARKVDRVLNAMRRLSDKILRHDQLWDMPTTRIVELNADMGHDVRDAVGDAMRDVVRE